MARRAAREPLPYVLGEWGFRRLTLTVDRRALVPRPETETVVERCLALLAGHDAPRVLDVGVGSGAIALAIADEHPGAARDRHRRLRRRARARRARTRERTGPRARAAPGRPPRRPPGRAVGPRRLEPARTSSSPTRPTLEPEVRDYEPAAALVGTGLHEAIAAAAVAAARRRRSARARGRRRSGGDRGRAPRRARLPRGARSTRDLAGRDRVVEGRRERSGRRRERSRRRARAASSSCRPTPSTASRRTPGTSRRPRAPLPAQGPCRGAADGRARGVGVGAPRARRRARRAGGGRRARPSCRARTRWSLPNPGRVLPWLCGPGAATIGVRVPELPAARPPRVLEAVGAARGDEREPARVARPDAPRRRPRRDPTRVPPRSSTAASCRASPRRCSTSPAPSRAVLREGAVPADDALAAVSRGPLGSDSIRGR